MSSRNTDWVAVGALSLLSTLIFQTGTFFLIFPAPLQFLRGKTDRRHFTTGCVVTVVLIGAIVAWRSAAAPTELRSVALYDGLVPIGLIIALWVTNELTMRSGKTAALAVAGAVAGLIALPSVSVLTESEAFRSQLAAQFAAAEEAISGFSGGAGIDEVFGVDDPAELFAALWMRTFAGGFTIMIGVNYLIGARLSRTIGDRMLERYRTPHWLPFALLIGLAGIVLESTFAFVPAGYLGWNLLVFTAAVFAAQAVGLLQFLVGADGTRPGRRALVPLGLIALFLIPLTGGLVSIGLPILGIIEHWMRRRDRGIGVA